MDPAAGIVTAPLTLLMLVTVTISVVEGVGLLQPVVGMNVTVPPAWRVTAPRATVVEVPVPRFSVSEEAPAATVVPAKVCVVVPALPPSTVSRPPPKVSAEEALIILVGLDRLAKSRVSVPRLTAVPPV